MAKITRDEIAEKNLFGDIEKSAKEAKEQIVLLEDSLKLVKQTASTIKKSATTVTPTNNTELKKQNELIKDANTLTAQKVKLDNQLVKAELKLEATDKQRAQELARVRLEQSRLNKEAKEAAELSSKQTGAYRKATIQLAKLKRELKDATIAEDRNEKQVEELQRAYDKLDKQIRETDQGANDFTRSIGNYENALKGITENSEGVGGVLGDLAGGKGGGFGGVGSAISGVVGKLGPWGAAVGAAIGGATALGSAVVEIDEEFDNLRGTIQQLTGLEGNALDRLTASLKGLEDTFGADTNESLRAANVLIKEFGLSGEEATKLIEDGFLSNANVQGDLLDSINEYSTQIKAAGGDADDLFKILDASGTAGVFSDKGIDTVKEFGLRIREQSTATSEALEKGFGEEFTNDLFKGINDGSLSTVEALQLVTKELESAELSTKDRQTIIADVFGGAGEDAGSFLETLTQINFETKFNADLTGDLAKKNKENLEANKALADAQNDLSKAIGDSSTLGRAWTRIQTFAIEKLTDFVIGIENLVTGFSMLKTEPLKALKIVFNAINNFLLIPFRFAIDELNLLIGLFSDFQIPDFDINLPVDDLKKFNAEQREANRITRIAAKRIEQLESATIKLVGAEEANIKALADGNLTQEDRNELITDLTEKYPELIKNYDLENLSQEDAARLQRELRAEIIETTIIKQKSLALTLLDQKVKEEQFKIDKIRNAEVRKQKQDELNFEKKRQLQRINNIEKEVRIQLGLLDVVEEIKKVEEEDDTGVGAKGSARGSKTTTEKEKTTSATTPVDESFNNLLKEKEKAENDFQDSQLDAKTREENTVREKYFDLIEQAKKFGEDTTVLEEALRIELLEIQEKYDEKEKALKEKKAKEEEKKQAELLKKQFEDRNEIIDAATDKFIENADARIDKLDEEIDAAQRQSDFYKQLAAEGNIEAKESLAEQNAIIAEAEAKKQKIERRKQAVELVSSTIQSFNNELGEGKSTQEALKEALTGTATITALIASLPTFLEGTEDTGTHGQGVDGKGGFHAVLHPNERVLTKEQNSMIGGYSNSQVAEIMQNHRLGNFNLIETTNNQQDFSILEGKMDAIEKAIINKPETNIELGQITSTSMMIAQTKKRGKNITTNRYKVN